jgi:hypothetical protein
MVRLIEVSRPLASLYTVYSLKPISGIMLNSSGSVSSVQEVNIIAATDNKVNIILNLKLICIKWKIFWVLKISFFSVNDKTFEKFAINLFHFQASYNLVYRDYLQFLDLNPLKINSIKNIPFLPISFFKNKKVLTEVSDSQKVFYQLRNHRSAGFQIITFTT